MELVTGATGKTQFFSPDDCLITPIRRAIQHRQDVAVALDGAGHVVVRGKLGEYHATPALDMARFCAAPVARFQISVLDSRHALEAAIALAAPARNLDELLWMAAFHASGGRLLEGCNTYDVVQLNQWPNLSRLPHTPNTLRIAAMLTRHPTSVALAHRLLKVEPGELYRVYSAARCAGLANVVNGAVREPALKPHRNQTLLTQLMAKIAGL